MPVQFRPYAPADRAAMFGALTVVYGDGSPPEPEDELPSTRHHIVAMDGDVCAGFYAEFTFDTLRGAAVLPTGGLAMVGVVPDRRHTGVGSEMMRWALHDMQRRGKVVASLYPFAESWYRQFGYEVCGNRIKFSCPKSYLPKMKPKLPIRRLKWEEYGEVKPCYNAFAKTRSGLVRRDDIMWDRLFGRKKKAADLQYEKTVYAAGDPVEGYAVIAHKVDFHVDQDVAELAWNTPRGYETMMTFLRSLAANKSGLCWYEPPDSPFFNWHLASSQLMKISCDKPVMYRVLDVPKAVALLPATAAVDFTFSVTDADMPANNGPWRVTSTGGMVIVDGAKSADIEFDIRSFTQAFLGQPSIDDVIRNGYARVKSAKAVDGFRALMPPTPVYCLDFF
ncbi:MAG TPA: GNAT family N-acetyltransferase [Fimbriimonadaceae bacterium]|nr:GNAT family N-acetyltransferase [Fimbriimonadaceae bacterium]